MCAVVGIFGVLTVFNPLAGGGTRVAWGVAAAIALGAGFLVWDRRLRSAAARNARRSERPGVRPGTRERSYRGYAYDIAVEWFERDAALLASDGYRVAHVTWEPLQMGHPVQYALLSALGVLTGNESLGQYGGTLRVTYEVGATQEQAVTALASFRRRLNQGPPAEPFV